MPLQHKPKPAAEYTTPRETTALDTGLNSVPVAETETRTVSTPPALSPKANRFWERYRVSSVGVVSALKLNVGLILGCVLWFLCGLVWRGAHHEPLTTEFVTGSALYKTTWYLFVLHLTNFKGRTDKAWKISWLVRFACGLVLRF